MGKKERMNNMKRYVLQTDENQFVTWIQWTAGVIPTIRNDVYDKSYIVSDEYLDYLLERTGKTRKQLLEEYHPNLKILEVSVTLVG